MGKNRRRSRTMSLREAASVVFALVALLPILLFVYLLSRHELLHNSEAQLGLLAAVAVSILGFMVFRKMVDQMAVAVISDVKKIEPIAIAYEPRRIDGKPVEQPCTRKCAAAIRGVAER